MERHANKVMGLIKACLSNESFSSEKLVQTIKTETDWDLEQDTFNNCHGACFKFDELLDFFVSKGKLLKNEDGFCLNPEFSCGCQH